MTAHVSNNQILEHIKSAHSVSVEGKIYSKIKVTDKKVSIGPFDFMVDHFDVGGLTREAIILVDTNQEFRHIMILDEEQTRVEHPNWNGETYDADRIRNTHLIKPVKKLKVDEKK